MQDRPSFAELAEGLRRMIADELEPAADPAVAAALADAKRRSEALAAGGPDPEAAVEAAVIRVALTAAIGGLEPRLRFRARVAAHVAGLLEREAEAGSAPVAAEGGRLADLLGRDAANTPAGVRKLQGEAAASIRGGELDDRLDEVAAVLRAGLDDRLAVARPGWTELADDGRD